MAKPTSLPRWGDVSGDIVEPNSAKKDVAWVASEEPSNAYMNWLQHLTYLWLAYLDSGALEGNHTVEGNLSTTSGGTFTSAGLITASAGVTAAADQHVTVSGTGLFKHGTRRKLIPIAAAGYKNTGVTVDPTTGAFVTLGTATTDPSVTLPLDLDVGHEVTQVDFYVRKTSASGTITARVRRASSAGVVSNVATATNSDSNPGYITISPTFTFTLATGFVYWLDVVGGGTSGDSVYGAEVLYSQP